MALRYRLLLDLNSKWDIRHLDHPRIRRHNSLDHNIRSDHPPCRKHDPAIEIVPYIVLGLAVGGFPAVAVAVAVVVAVEKPYLSNSNYGVRHSLLFKQHNR